MYNLSFYFKSRFEYLVKSAPDWKILTNNKECAIVKWFVYILNVRVCAGQEIFRSVFLHGTSQRVLAYISGGAVSLSSFLPSYQNGDITSLVLNKANYYYCTDDSYKKVLSRYQFNTMVPYTYSIVLFNLYFCYK